MIDPKSSVIYNGKSMPIERVPDSLIRHLLGLGHLPKTFEPESGTTATGRATRPAALRRAIPPVSGSTTATTWSVRVVAWTSPKEGVTMPASVKRGFVGGIPEVFWASCHECWWWSDDGSNFCRSRDEAERKADGHNRREHPDTADSHAQLLIDSIDTGGIS